jgi:hypothetical protein
VRVGTISIDTRFTLGLVAAADEDFVKWFRRINPGCFNPLSFCVNDIDPLCNPFVKLIQVKPALHVQTTFTYRLCVKLNVIID